MVQKYGAVLSRTQIFSKFKGFYRKFCLPKKEKAYKSISRQGVNEWGLGFSAHEV